MRGETTAQRSLFMAGSIKEQALADRALGPHPGTFDELDPRRNRPSIPVNLTSSPS
ncbi:MAG: hypothetical protein AAGC60_13630 [Acidobacteriota bacterium]